MSKKGDSSNRRRKYIVDKSFQYSYLFQHATVGIVALIASVLMLFFLVYFQIAQGRVSHEPWSKTVAWDLALLFLLLLVLAVYRGVLHSHRIAGPVYRFRKVCERMAQGDLSGEVHLRRHDRMKDLAMVFNEMIRGLKERLQKDRCVRDRVLEELEHLQTRLQDYELSKEQSGEVQQKLNEMKQQLMSLGEGFTLDVMK